jgi:hypothetical protein
MFKICRKCQGSKPLEEFSVHAGRKDGRQGKCKACATEVSKEWYKAHKNDPNVAKRMKEYNKAKIQELRDEIDALKRETGCRYCPINEPCCLDFHHPGEKDRDVSHWVRMKSKYKLYEEVKRCVVVCSNCHRKIHAGLIVE